MKLKKKTKRNAHTQKSLPEREKNYNERRNGMIVDTVWEKGSTDETGIR